MGNNHTAVEQVEKPAPDVAATLYYFNGRGKADQIRWMLAATNTTFVQKTLTDRAHYLRLAEKQLTFATLPLLQIDGVELVQTQPIIRYLARKGKLAGQTPAEEVRCDIIADAIADLVSIAYSAPFRKCLSDEDACRNQTLMEERWESVGSRLEALLIGNGGKFMVGSSMTYADILVAHCITWYVEECGPNIMIPYPNQVDLQVSIISLPCIQHFIQTPQYYPPGGEDYVVHVSEIMGLPLPTHIVNRMQGKM
mmetsp:Transcript_17774/g.17854  ORF Transcript_17774/g.17854 Transcript_17774/m.17854 type:complete len:253 (-) Transcript_17774:155-913(-)|eukprot:CAMPEP_0182417466 /NCGR_PEP_ID=MMETSP1167-20130531/1958_1 /TAXON_ID=2988 /ORGANISM="Mallomonas Sp, Strain CCMP3275" /LENGTH=252 /DNA_ID=CAMNT_0024591075 /DNA_START=55 /DNA_END=813 /DNA_ORIENTATION=-